MTAIRRKISLYIIVTFFFSAYSYAHDIEYSSQIIPWQEIVERNTNYNIQRAKLLTNFVDTLEKEIRVFKNDHYIESEALESRAFELRIMSQELKNIQTINIEKHHADSIIESSILRLKTNKNETRKILKTKLKDSKLLLEQKIQTKWKVANKIGKRFSSFVASFTPKIRKLKNTEKKRLILLSLTNINKEASKLILFSSKEYSSLRHLDDSYNNSIRNIKRELYTIQAILKNT